MFSIDQARRDILHWVETFLEVPNKHLDGWSPCPYARRARLNNTVDIRPGTDPTIDLQSLANNGLEHFEVIVFVYDPKDWPRQQFAELLELANKQFLLDKDIIVLEDHPLDREIVNGVSMNQGKYALAMCQSLSDLNIKAKAIASKGFYNIWPEEYLEQLFQHRQDPRQ